MNELVIQRARQIIKKYYPQKRAINWINCIIAACQETLGCTTWEDVQNKFLNDYSEDVMPYYEIEKKILRLYPYERRVIDNE
jgi:hypothetical protein